MASIEDASGAAEKMTSVSLSDGPANGAAVEVAGAVGKKGKAEGKDGEKKKGPKALPAEVGEYHQQRIAMFEELQRQQKEHRQQVGGEPIKVSINGQVVEGKKWLSTPFDIGKTISKDLVKDALIAKVDDVLWDMARPLEGDCSLQIFSFVSAEGRDTFWHSSAHILGEALEQEYGCDLCIGPCTTRGEGFYYDAFYGDFTLEEEQYKAIKAKAGWAVKQKQNFERIEVTREQAMRMFDKNRFKLEIIRELPADKTITVYRCGPLVDLCRGPHIPNTGAVKAFHISKAAAAYWRGDQTRESLQRVYGISYPNDTLLQEYLHRLEEAKKRDHRLLGMQQELFFFHPLSPGSCFFLPHGARVYNRLQEFIRGEYRARGYQEVVTPNMYNLDLWVTSGHAANYKENMFLFDVEKQQFGLKPMNCPGHCLLFDHRVRSYRELPLRLADFGVLHRNEASGALTGLTRVRRFQQDDAHIFCTEAQIEEEVRGVLDFLAHAYGIFGFEFDLELSTRPEKYLGELAVWDKAEAFMAKALDSFGKKWQINAGDGAFYGPKIDITVYDALKRKFQCATIQLDFQLPIRFNLTYNTESLNSDEKTRPVMIHRAILGSVERMFAILLEHYAGKWPLWLSPRQVIVCPVSEKHHEYSKQVAAEIERAGFYVEVDYSDRKLPKKIREAQLAQHNFILVCGAEELESKTVNVRTRDNQVHGTKPVAEIIADLRQLVAEYK